MTEERIREIADRFASRIRTSETVEWKIQMFMGCIREALSESEKKRGELIGYTNFFPNLDNGGLIGIIYDKPELCPSLSGTKGVYVVEIRKVKEDV